MNIKINNLAFAYNKKSRPVLSNLSLEIKQGNIMIVLGLNGSGKTTLIKCLAGLLNPNDGTIAYGERFLNDISIKERSRIFSYVSQKGASGDDILIEDYLLYGMTNSLAFYQTPSKFHIEKARSIAKKFGVDKFLNRKLGEISGGERQLVGICQAILQDTDVIILDEPFSALDLKNQQLVLATLRDVSREEGKTMIISDHNPNHALFLDCDVALMNDSTIYKTGSAKDMITLENLKPIYGNNICESRSLYYNEVSII